MIQEDLPMRLRVRIAVLMAGKLADPSVENALSLVLSSLMVTHS